MVITLFHGDLKKFTLNLGIDKITKEEVVIKLVLKFIENCLNFNSTFPNIQNTTRLNTSF